MSLEQLKSYTNCLLNNDDPAAVHTALTGIHTIFYKYASVRGDVLESRHDQDTFLPGGVAISPHLAARCLFDPVRTVQFLRGIHAGIHEAMRRFPGEPIHIAYAGCGPYATLLLPLTTQFLPAQIQLTLIDINQPSIDGVQRLITGLGLNDYIHAVVQADAVTYQHPDTYPLHMVVSETMQAGLAREPQLAITRNFLPQLAENGLFIPENIEVTACLSRSTAEDIGLLMHRDALGYPVGRTAQVQENHLPLGRVLTLNARSAHPDALGRSWEPISLVTLDIPHRDEQFDQFLLMTAVTVFGAYGFGPYECELSFPLRLHDLDYVAGGSKVQFSYTFGRKPGLQHQMVR